MITLGERAEQALKIVREASVIAFDTETSGLDWKRNHPIGYVITEEKNSVYIPIRHAGGGNLSDPNCGPLVSADGPTDRHYFEIELSRAFKDRQTAGHLTVGHNIGFDMHFAANQGIHLGRNCEDTQLNEAMLDEFCKSFSLDALSKAYGVTVKLGDDLYRHIASQFGGEPSRKQMEHFWRTNGSEPVVREYAEGDGISTLELRAEQIKRIKQEEMGLIHDIESKLIWTVFRMERKGMRCDVSRIDAVKDTIQKRLVLAREALPSGFNERSGTQVKKLFENAGITNWPLTTLGNPSFPEKWLKKSLQGRAIIDKRKLTNLLNSFITPLEERHIFNGYVHAQLNQLKGDEYGTISGRFSSSNPNMQQVPKRDKELGRLFRSIFIPDDGYVIHEGDYSQCEPRLFSHYSKSPVLIDGYSQTPFKDLHYITAELMSVERDPTAKRMGMGILTGMQPASLGGHMGWDLATATNMFNEWMSNFPEIKAFQTQAKNVFRSRGYVKTILGRRCRLDNPRFAYRGTSRIIQGSNADIVKYKLLHIDMWLESEGDIAHFLNTIHDSFVFQTPLGEQGDKIRDEIVRMACDVQSPPFNLRVPFVIDVGSGPDWGVATYGKEIE